MTPAKLMDVPGVSDVKQEWLSLEGYLYMKWLGALTFLQTKKRLYFGLDENENVLIYFKDKNDFDKKCNRIGLIPLANSACTLADGNSKGFIIHAESKKYELEAENNECANCWLNALQNRKDINDNNFKNGVLPTMIYNNLKRYRSRSRSLGSQEKIQNGSFPIRNSKRVSRKIKSFKWQNNYSRTGDSRKIKRMKSFNQALISRTETGTSTNSAVSEVVDAEKLISETVINKEIFNCSKTIRKTSAPLWFNDRITTWLEEQQKTDLEPSSGDSNLHDLRLSSSDTGGPDHQNLEEKSDSEVSNCSESSGTTSTYDSEKINSMISISENEQLSSEILFLKQIDNRQKEQILELTRQKNELEKRVEQLTIAHSTNQLPQTQQNKFLNAEVLRLNERYQTAEKQLEEMKKKNDQIQLEMEDFKKEYVFLLQSCVRIPIHEHSNFDVVQVKLFGGDVHHFRVRKLLNLARQSDPTLPTFESVTTSSSFHIDEYGFKHCFENENLALHYICTQLHQHYASQADEYVMRKKRWQFILNQENCSIENNHENRNLCRFGIPRSLRSKVWRVLINQQVADIKEKFGNYYYRNLCQSQGTIVEKHYINVHQKQINLDLLRTMPNNIHFMSATCKGVTHLQAILRAYCLHNPSIGYCQGMNFITATALLFVSPEDAFWFLVAITERYFDKSYFDQSLTGAQADQELLKEILEQKYPKLAKHLEEYDIDLTTITLNWFLALFFDAVPFQTMLRIWDCFLLEGSKVLFKISIALLGLYEEEILDRSDTISVIKVLKAAVRLTYDVDGLIQYAFNEIPNFPSKNQLISKQAMYLTMLQDRLKKRQQFRDLFGDSSNSNKMDSDKLCDLPVHYIAFSSSEAEVIGYVGVGNQNRGKLAMISFFKEGATNLNMMELEFDCRPVSMVTYDNGMAFISLLSGYVIALQLNDGEGQILWELKLNDIALKLIHAENKLYAGLANGTLTVLEDAFNKAPTALDLYHIPISAAPVTDAIIIEDNLYLAVACKIVILNKSTLSPIGNIYVAASACGSTAPMFEKIRAISNSPRGIWIITAHSSLIQLWKESECQLLFDVTYDHSHRKPSFNEEDDFNNVEINAILYYDDEIWIGTLDGYLMLYKVVPMNETAEYKAISHGDEKLNCEILKKKKPSTSNEISFSLHRYPPGRRLQPDNNIPTTIPIHRQQMYYIPTPKETQNEENASWQEHKASEMERRKISVVIDQNTKQYSVSVAPLRSASVDSATGTMKSPSTSTQNTVSTPLSRTNPLNLSITKKLQLRQKHHVLEKERSIDSAVSVFSDQEHGTQKSPTDSEGSPHFVHPIEEATEPETFAFSTGGASLEYDDMFEMYSDPDTSIDIGLIEDVLQSRSPSPNPKMVKIPVRKMSFNAFGPCQLTLSREDTTIETVMEDAKPMKLSTTTGADSTGSMTETPETILSVPKLRRKDLDFDDPVILAVKDNVPETITEAERKLSLNDELTILESEIKSKASMILQMKLKISDKPVRCISLTSYNDESIVITGSGNYGDEEAILRWRKEKNTGLWINDPLVDISVRGRKRTVFNR